MKNSNLTYSELVHHLDLYSTDPMVRQLINYILDGDGIIEGLVNEGMDPTTQEFCDSYSYYSPGDYIKHLRDECDSMEQEMRLAQEDLETMTDERDRLKTRSVAELLASMEELVKRSKSEASEAYRAYSKVEAENDELKEKINVWTIMERP